MRAAADEREPTRQPLRMMGEAAQPSGEGLLVLQEPGVCAEAVLWEPLKVGQGGGRGRSH